MNSNIHISDSVPDFYAGKSIFITGGTGFIGKILIEKLLRSCPDLNKIYILIRRKQNNDGQTRVHQLISNDIYKQIKKKRPQDLNKIIPIVGDLVAPNLGLQIEDERVLLENVSVVYHSAATVKFNEPLSTALKINVEGTIKVLDLCRRMTHINAFVYVSTVFTNTDRVTVEEVVYPPPAALEDVYRFLETHGDDDEHVATLLNGRPNTYTFTKALAESYVTENHFDVPTIIVRPSIVTATISEPVAGWLENWNGASGLIIAGYNGMIRVVTGDGNNTIDLIPVDCVTNLMIVAASKSISNTVYVYNSCTSYSNKLTLRKLFRCIISKNPTHRLYDVMQHILIIFTRHKWIYFFITYVFEFLPAHIVDVWMRIIRKKPRYVRLQQRLLLLREVLEYFTTRTWDFRSARTEALSESLSQTDRQLFPFDPRDIVWHEYIPKYCEGINQYLINNKQSK